MTTLRKAAQQALEALKDTHYRIIGAGLMDQDLLDRNFTVAIALRQALAQEQETMPDDLIASYEKGFKDGELAEREACAKVLEGISNAPDMQAYANAIRARGEK